MRRHVWPHAHRMSHAQACVRTWVARVQLGQGADLAGCDGRYLGAEQHQVAVLALGGLLHDVPVALRDHVVAGRESHPLRREPTRLRQHAGPDRVSQQVLRGRNCEEPRLPTQPRDDSVNAPRRHLRISSLGSLLGRHAQRRVGVAFLLAHLRACTRGPAKASAGSGHAMPRCPGLASSHGCGPHRQTGGWIDTDSTSLAEIRKPVSLAFSSPGRVRPIRQSRSIIKATRFSGGAG